MNIVEEKWPEIIEHLRVEHELSNVSFNTWIKQIGRASCRERVSCYV